VEILVYDTNLQSTPIHTVSLFHIAYLLSLM